MEAADAGPAGIELATDGSANWARGDTLIAVFERVAAPVADSVPASDPFMLQLVLEGDASAFYRMVRDSTTSARPSLNYLIARRIQVDFEAGEPTGVEGEHAIGAYLEPREAFGTPSPADSAAAVADSAGAATDSLGAPADTTGVPPDSAALSPDTVGALPDTVEQRRHLLSDVQLAAGNRRPGRERRAMSHASPTLRPGRSR